VISSPCADCDGAGARRRTHTLSVRIPAGVDTRLAPEAAWRGERAAATAAAGRSLRPRPGRPASDLRARRGRRGLRGPGERRAGGARDEARDPDARRPRRLDVPPGRSPDTCFVSVAWASPT
jgi:hypothetical protein